MFEIASNTKVLTAVLLQRLVDLGKLSMDTTVGHFLNDRCRSRTGGKGVALSSAVSGITVLELATHTSGLPAQPDNRHTKGDNPFAKYTEQDLCDCLARLQALPARGKFIYSNLAFGLLGYLIELHQEQPFEEVLKEHVLKPLGMDNTKVSLLDEEWSSLVAPGVHRVSGTWPIWRRSEYGILQGNGALHSTLGDMAKFLAAAVRAERGETGPLVGTLRRTMRSVQWDCPCYSNACENLKKCSGDQPTFNRGMAGLGWQSFSHGMRHGWLKAGDTEGYSSFMAFISQAGRAVIGFDTCGGCGSEGGQGSAIQRAVKILVGGPPAPRQSAPHVLRSELESISGVYESSSLRAILEVSVHPCARGGKDPTIIVKTTTGSESAESEAFPFVPAVRHNKKLMGLELKSSIGSDGIGAGDVRPLTDVSQNREIVFLTDPMKPGSVAVAVLSDGGKDTFFEKKSSVKKEL